MTDLNQELQRVVTENMNDVELGVFKREFSRLQSMEVDFVQLREEYKLLLEEFNKLTKEYTDRKDEMAEVLSREEDLVKREVTMTEQKTQLHIDSKLLALKLENAELRVADHKAMVNDIFRGPVFTKSVVENVTNSKEVPQQQDEYGNARYVPTETHMDSSSKNTNTTESQE